jgi:hypothetical protein
MNNKITKRIFVSLFALLYISVALVSTYHAVYFFGLANVSWIAIMLAITFEIGQAAVLFSILTNATGKRKILPWILMITLTLVQVLGNVYSSYKYLITNSESLLRYFKEPIFVWMDLPDAQANVILTYIIGAILPIVSLLMTGMVTNYLGKSEDEPEKLDIVKDEPEQTEEKSFNEAVPGNVVTIPTDEVPVVRMAEEPVEPTIEEPVEPINEEPVEEKPQNETDELREVLKSILSKNVKTSDELTLDEVKDAVKTAQEKQKPIEESIKERIEEPVNEHVNEEPKRKSHFVNLKNKTTS